MSFQLGIDLGSTSVAAAAVLDGRVDVFPLGPRSNAAPLAALAADDGVERSPVEFAAWILEHVLARATERQGSAPSRVVVAHRATAEAAQLELLARAAAMAGAPDAVLLPAPRAAAWYYAHDHRVDRDEVVAVFDAGGRTSGAALVRAVGGDFELLGQPYDVAFGGVDVDDAIVEHLRHTIDDLFPVDDAQAALPEWRAAMARLRNESRTLKERLADVSEAVVSVVTPSGSQLVRVRRADVEPLVRARVEEAVRTLDLAVASAGLTMADVSRVVLVGGGSQLPLVRTLVAGSTGRPVAIVDAPDTAVASGAAQWQPRRGVPAMPSTPFAPPPGPPPTVPVVPPPPVTAAPLPPASLPPLAAPSAATVTSATPPPPPPVASPPVASEPLPAVVAPVAHTGAGGPDAGAAPAPAEPPVEAPVDAPVDAAVEPPVESAPAAVPARPAATPPTRPTRRRRPPLPLVVAALALVAVVVGVIVWRSGDDEPAGPTPQEAVTTACAELRTAGADLALPATPDEVGAFAATLRPELADAMTAIGLLAFGDPATDDARIALVDALSTVDVATETLATAAAADLAPDLAALGVAADAVQAAADRLGVVEGCLPPALTAVPAAGATTVPPETTTVGPTSTAPTTAAPTTSVETTVAPTTPTTFPPGPIQGIDLSPFWSGSDGTTLAAFDPATLQSDVVDSWQADPTAGPALAAIYGSRVLDGAGAEVAQAFVFVGSQPLAGTPAGDRIVQEFTTPPAAIATVDHPSGAYAGTLFTLQTGVSGWVAASGNSVVLVFGAGDQAQVQGVVDGLVAANAARPVPGVG